MLLWTLKLFKDTMTSFLYIQFQVRTNLQIGLWFTPNKETYEMLYNKRNLRKFQIKVSY
jgi:hypothetical protein